MLKYYHNISGLSRANFKKSYLPSDFISFIEQKEITRNDITHMKKNAYELEPACKAAITAEEKPR